MKQELKTIARAYHTAIQNGADVKKSAKNTVQLLRKKNLISGGSDILDEVTRILNKESNVVTAQVFSRYELPSSLLDKIEKLLKEKYNAEEVQLAQKIDESLIGGFKIIVGDEIIDSTLSGKLKQLQATLSE